MTVRPAKTYISLGIRPVWSVFAVRMKKAWVLTCSYPLSAQRRLWSDWAYAQADLSLRWAHSLFSFWFCHEAAQLCILTAEDDINAWGQRSARRSKKKVINNNYNESKTLQWKFESVFMELEKFESVYMELEELENLKVSIWNWGEGTFYVITFCVHKSVGTQFEWY